MATQRLNDLLKATSRSFYLTLGVLPARVRPQIGLAYLLARMADTIADTEIVALDRRLAALQQLRERILGQTSAPLKLGDFARQQDSPLESALLEKVESAIAELQKLSVADLTLVREVLAIITSGQELDLRRFKKASTENIVALESAAELDDYTWRVAGCVGQFWTKICRAHLFPNAKLNNSFAIEFGARDAGVEKFFSQLDDSFLIQLGIRFGKGLQLVNILRDLPSDLNKGRCYLPMEKLEPAKLFPEILLSPANEAKFLPLFRKYLEEAQAHLRAGWIYTNMLPFGQFRVRLACAWPILIGMKTIEKLRVANVIDLRRHVKISHGERNGILLRSILACPLPAVWRRLFPADGKAVDSGPELA